MNAEIVSIGTELLLGHIVNTNAAYLSQKLAELGIDIYHQTTVGDNPARLTNAIRHALLRSDIVITSGGLGPTVDDVTIETLAQLLGKRLVNHKGVLKDLNDYFKFRKLKTPPETLRQAIVPEGVKIIRNKIGTAPGLIAEYHDKVIICLPGPPREIEPMFANNITPWLKKHYTLSAIRYPLISRTIKITGLAESQVNGKVEDILKLKPPTAVGIYAKLGEVNLKIMAKAKTVKEAEKAIKIVENKIRSRLKDNIFGYDGETLEGVVGKILISKKKTISVAESCTGGLISHRITNVPGSSKYYKMGVVTYSNEAKENILGVSPKLLEKHGAVSKPVAIEMAKGIRLLGRTDIGLAVTGIAGPGGGTKTKPVGLVYIAFVTKNKTIVREFRFRGSREEVKFQASQSALDLVRRNI